MKHAKVLIAVMASLAMSVGLVLHKDAATEHPPDTYSARWTWCSAALIGPDLIISTKHQGGAPGNNAEIAGKAYKVGKVWKCPGGDLQIGRIVNPDGTPVRLSGWVHVSDVDKAVLRRREVWLGGWGRQRGEVVKDKSGNEIGYKWDGSQGKLVWGTNRIDNIVGGGIIMMDFDGLKEGTRAEAGFAQLDSGGGIFLPTYRTEQQGGGCSKTDEQGSGCSKKEVRRIVGWQLVGISLAAATHGASIYDPPGRMIGIHLKPHLKWIEQVKAEAG